MPTLVALLTVATIASAIWCVREALAARVQRPRPRGIGALADAAAFTAVIAAAIGLRVFLIPPHHAMYVDEPWYAEAACNLAHVGRLELCEETWSGRTCEPYAKGSGWPTLLSPWLAMLGCSSVIGIQISRLLGVATVMLVALATRCAGGTWRQGIFAAALLALHPVHVVWSSTAETNVAHAAVWLAGLCGALWYLRSARLCAAALATAALALATTIRAESFASVVVVAASLFFLAPTARRRRLPVALTIVLGSALALMEVLPLWAMNAETSNGAFFELGNILTNLRRLHGDGTLHVHGLVALLAAAGSLVWAAARTPRLVVMLLITAMTAALVALAYDRFHERMLLAATVTALPLCGFLLAWMPTGAHPKRARALAVGAWMALMALPLLQWRAALEAAATPAETQVLETRLAARVGQESLPADSLVIAGQPTVLGAVGVRHVMATRHALEDQAQLLRRIAAGSPVYFLCDMYCEDDLAAAASAPSCKRILQELSLEPVLEETLNRRSYVLYRLTGPAHGNPRPPGCPTRDLPVPPAP